MLQARQPVRNPLCLKGSFACPKPLNVKHRQGQNAGDDGEGLSAQTRNSPIPNSGAISQIRHQARASSSVLPKKSCSSDEVRVTTHPA
jgi:hypothetical protein